jgi:hypothetical protein
MVWILHGQGFPTWFQTLGPGIQTLFSQIGYNQNALHDNISWRQVQQYQKKNYQIAWIGIARRDILSMMSISVNRINNYLIVGTLILGVSSGAFWSAKFNGEHDDPAVIVAFYCNIALSMIYLVMSIVFGVRGQNKAFLHTLRLLTFHIRPENPAEYNHDYMQQMQWIEKLGLEALFRIPGLMPSTEHHEQEHKDLLQANFAGSTEFREMHKQKGHRLEDFTALENLDMKTTHTWYLSRYADFMQLWLWYEKYARLSMGLGIISLLHGCVYLLVWRLSHLQPEDSGRLGNTLPASLMMVLILTVLWVILRSNRKLVARISSTQALWIGAMFIAPALGSIAGWLDMFQSHGSVEGAFAVLCYLCHTSFWVLALVLHETDSRIKAERRIVLGSFWSEDTAEVAVNVDHEEERKHRENDNAISDVPGMQPVQEASSFRSKEGALQQEHWPTESPVFDQQVLNAQHTVKGVVRQILVVTIMFWVLIVVATIDVIAREGNSSGQSANMKGDIPLAILQGPFLGGAVDSFDGHAISCIRSKVFGVDEHAVYDFRDDAQTFVACNLEENAKTVDVSGVCDATGLCYPVVLQTSADNSTHIIDCYTGGSSRLLQEKGPAEYLSVYEVIRGGDLYEQRLVVAHDGNLLQYRWSQNRGGWEPEWSLGQIGGNSKTASLSGLATVESSLLLFFNAWEQGQAAVERHDLNTMRADGAWHISSPSMPSSGGCAMDPHHVMTFSLHGSPRLSKFHLA